MKYIDAKKLVEMSLDAKLFNIHEDKILLYRNGDNNSKEGWYATDKEDVIHLLMYDELGQKVLIEELKEKGTPFENL